MTKKSAFAAAICAAIVATSPAIAEGRETVFAYEEGELANASTIAALYKRLRLHAKRACELPSPVQRRQELNCRRHLETTLVAKIGNSALLALHESTARTERLAKAD